MSWWYLVGIDSEVPWPEDDYYVEFQGQKILLRPSTEQRMPMICIECEDRPMNHESVAMLAREFMSELVWIFPYPLIEKTTAGASFCMALGPAPRFRSTAMGFYIDYLPRLQEAKPKLALAFFREAISVNSIPYSFLGYWKIVSLLHGDGSPNQTQWLKDSLPLLTYHDGVKRLTELRAAGESDEDIVKKRLYVSRRCAVAHATSQPVINPDDPSQELEIRKDLPLVRAIAEYAIEFEFKIKSSQTVWKEHLYELDGFKQFFGEALVNDLKAGKTPTPQPQVQLPHIDIRLADKTPLDVYSDLSTTIRQMVDGKVIVDCVSSNRLVITAFVLDFSQERFEFYPTQNVAIGDDGSPLAVRLGIEHLQFCSQLFSNARLQVFEHGSNKLLGRKDPFIADNIDLNGQLQFWRSQIEQFKVEEDRRLNATKDNAESQGKTDSGDAEIPQ